MARPAITFAQMMPRSDAKRVQLLALSVGVLAALFWGCGGGRDAPPETIVLITLDTTRADHLGCYGYPRPTSPNIDRFAETAMV